MKERELSIDFLRTFSILGVIAIHVLSFSLNNPVNIFIWNSLQFVVGIFIFCSGFVHAHYIDKLISFNTTVVWLKKRFIRILLPFYVYFIIHLSLYLFFPQVFTHFGLKLNTNYVFGSLFLYGGINGNWLPLLFLELTLLTPILFSLHKRKLLWTYIFIAMIIIGLGTIYLFPYFSYRGIMWLGWSFIFLFGLFFSKLKRHFIIYLTIVSAVVFSFLFYLWPIIHRSVNFTENKYPPNFYFLSYAIFGTLIAFFLAKKFIHLFPLWIYEYISKKSYTIFFIHYVVLDAILSMRFIENIFLQLVLTIALSLLISSVVDKIIDLGKFRRQSLPMQQ